MSLRPSGWLSSKESTRNAGATGDGVQSLGWEDPLEEDMATNSSILAWRVPWSWKATVIGSQRIGHDWSDLAQHSTLAISLPSSTLFYISTDTELAAYSECYSINTVKLVVFGKSNICIFFTWFSNILLSPVRIIFSRIKSPSSPKLKVISHTEEKKTS